MAWATTYIETLIGGRSTSFRPRGDSMVPLVLSDQLCVVEPVDPARLVVGDIVLCRVRGAEYLHLVRAIQGGLFQIGNARGHVNGWVDSAHVYGKLTSVDGRAHTPTPVPTLASRTARAPRRSARA